ncbi:MAG: glycosyltransferase [Dehalococcoidia bacterium]|nr:glycosyltransferase [Dehalococcoidia bacterium]
MQLSVIIPVRDDARISRCVASVCAAAANLDKGKTQVIVVNNGSGPELAPVLAGLPPSVEVLTEPIIGPFAARNRGLERATGAIVLFTDAACIVAPDWLTQAINGFAANDATDILQGYSGSMGRSSLDRFIQSRYDSRFRGQAPGMPVECDTRNLAVRRSVFDRMRFNDRWRRVGDTEFGLVAEQMGHRVAFWPALRVVREHDAGLCLFLAKQVSHGWGAQRLVRQMPDLRWHSGHPREIAGLASTLAKAPGSRLALSGGLSLILTAGGLLAGRLRASPNRLDLASATLLDKLAVLLGHFLYEAGADEPWPADILAQRLHWSRG